MTTTTKLAKNNKHIWLSNDENIELKQDQKLREELKENKYFQSLNKSLEAKL